MSDQKTSEQAEEQVRDAGRRALLGAGAAGVAAIGLGAGSSAAQPTTGAPRASQPINLVERELTYRSGNADIKAFWAEPPVRPRAAIIVIHEIWGLNAHIRDVARRYARQGYVALALDLYTRRGTPKLDINNRPALMEFLASVSDPQVVADLQSGIEYLNGQGIERVGSMGFCMGGLYSYLLACKSEKLQAAVDFYGRIVYADTTANKPESPVTLTSQLKCPLLCHFGETDASIPLADIEKLREALQASRQPWKINVYPGAGHAFYNNTRPAYNQAAAADAGTETLQFFQKHLQL